MPEYCTCGTKFVENARFCHRCGRPAFDLVAADPAESLPTEVPQAVPLQVKLAQLPVSFSNPVALRVGFLMSLGIMFLDMIPVLNFLFLVWWIAGGWGGVILYRRLTGRHLSVSGGARLGFMTGVLVFVSLAIVLALTMGFKGREFLDLMIRQNPQMSQVVNDPAMLAAGFLFFLAITFGAVVGFCAAGGALGARFSGPGQQDPGQI